MSRILSLLSVTGLVASAVAFTPALTTPSTQEKNSTFLTGWITDEGRGTLNQGVTLLSNGTDTAINSTYYGVVVYFNETLAMNQTRSPIPFIAAIACDSNPSTQATLTLPFDSNGTIASNSTLTNSTIGSNSTDLTNSTISGMNGTMGTNSTTMENGNSTYLSNIFDLAAQMGASSVFLYSEQAESCQLNYTANAAFNHSIPIFTSPTLEISNQIRSTQFDNINSEHRYFNSTMISAAAANLSSIISSGGSNGIPTQFLIGRLTASYNQSDSNSGVVATIGRAPSSIRTADGSAQTTNPSTGGPSSGAVQALGGVAFLTSLFATGIAVLAV
ncbi:hypothetical protein JCM5353_000769 [Sporobolomyces roseus]